MIIVEGPDGGGKSTLCDNLRRTFGVEVIHSGGPPDSVTDLRQRFERQLASRGKILDRCMPVSELAYGTVSKRLVLPRTALWCLAQRFNEDGWLMVYCRPSLETLEQYADVDMTEASADKPHKTPGQVRFVRANLPAIVGEYDAIMEGLRATGMAVLKYDRDEYP